MKPQGLNKYNIIDDTTCEVLTTSGVKFLISPECIDLIREHTWCVHRDRYICSKVNGKRVFLHNYLIPHEEGFIVDHVHGDTFDYRLFNLRLIKKEDNRYNLKQYKNCKIFRGVSKFKSRYIARIQHNGNPIFLGSFLTVDEAIKARIEAEKKYFGELRRYK